MRSQRTIRQCKIRLDTRVNEFSPEQKLADLEQKHIGLHYPRDEIGKLLAYSRIWGAKASCVAFIRCHIANLSVRTGATKDDDRVART